jgi:hypothetical protein
MNPDQNVVMRFSFPTKSRAVAFQAELNKLGISGSTLRMVQYQWTVKTDTRCLVYAEHLHRVIYAVPDKHKQDADALRKCTGAVKVTVSEQVRNADGTIKVTGWAVSE